MEWMTRGRMVDSLNRAVFKWLSKVMTWLRFLHLVIGLKDSRQFFSQWEAKPKPIAPCTRDFSRALSKFHIIARNCDWFIALPAPVVIGRSNCFGFSTVIWKPLYYINKRKQKTRLCIRGMLQFIFTSLFKDLQLYLRKTKQMNSTISCLTITTHPIFSQS